MVEIEEEVSDSGLAGGGGVFDGKAAEPVQHPPLPLVALLENGGVQPSTLQHQGVDIIREGELCLLLDSAADPAGDLLLNSGFDGQVDFQMVRIGIHSVNTRDVF